MLARQVNNNVFTAVERCSLRSVFETFSPLQSDAPMALALIERKVELLPAYRGAQFRSLLQMLGGRWLSAALAHKPIPFSNLSFLQRERMLLKMAHSGVPALRAAFQALKRACLFAAYAAADDTCINPLWEHIGYPGPRTDRLPFVAPLRVERYPPEELFADVVIVGSGAGGSVSAAVFAQAGNRVVVLEAGSYLGNEAFTQREAEMLSALYLDAAGASSEDLAIPLLAGACIGGGTTVNSCACIELPQEIAAQWSLAAGGVDFNGTLARHMAAVSERLQLTLPYAHNRNNAVLARGCERLGWHCGCLLRNAENCGDGCGYCGLGCAYGCKRSTPATYLHDAVSAGARVVAGAHVERVLTRGARVAGVVATVEGSSPGEMRRPLRVYARKLVLAAGSLRTPAILARSGLRSEHVGRHLRLHPTTGLAAIFESKIEMWHGPMQTVYSDQFANLNDAYGARLEAVPVHPGQAALALPWQGRAQHFALMQEVPRMAALISLTRDRGEGYLSGFEALRVQYRMHPYDSKHMLTALDGLVDVALAAGAERVVTPHSAPLSLKRSEASAHRRAAFRDALFAAGALPNRLGIYSAHQMGTCRMHRDPLQGVVDENCSVHGMRGLLITDASVFPLASGVNPMLTIMALAHRAASFHASL